jgi:hypothetical protein
MAAFLIGYGLGAATMLLLWILNDLTRRLFE